MAMRLCSASESRVRSSSTLSSSRSALIIVGQSQSCQQAFAVGHVTDDATHGSWLDLDQRRDGDDVVHPDALRHLVHVDDFEIVLAAKMLFAHLADDLE